MFKYVATWNYIGVMNRNTFVDYFESESSNIIEVSNKIHFYLKEKYNYNDIHLSVERQNIKYIII